MIRSVIVCAVLAVLVSVSHADSEGGDDSPPPVADISHIVLTNEGDTKKVGRALASASGDELFKQIAFSLSHCESGEAGGRVGSVYSGELMNSINDVIFDPATALNKTVGPIQTVFGQHFVRVHSRSDGFDSWKAPDDEFDPVPQMVHPRRFHGPSETNPSMLRLTEEMFNSSHILVKSKSMAIALKKYIMKNVNLPSTKAIIRVFGVTAKYFSVCPTASNNGRLPEIKLSQEGVLRNFPQELLNAVMSAKTGYISGPVKSHEGWHLIIKHVHSAGEDFNVLARNKPHPIDEKKCEQAMRAVCGIDRNGVIKRSPECWNDNLETFARVCGVHKLLLLNTEGLLKGNEEEKGEGDGDEDEDEEEEEEDDDIDDEVVLIRRKTEIDLIQEEVVKLEKKKQNAVSGEDYQKASEIKNEIKKMTDRIEVLVKEKAEKKKAKAGGKDEL